MLRTAFIKSLLLVVFTGTCVALHAQSEPSIDSVLSGKDGKIVVGAKAYVKDAVFFDPILKPTIYTTNKVNNIITLKLSEAENFYIADSLQLSAQVRVIYTNSSNAVDSVTRTLSVKYNKYGADTSQAHFYFSNAYEVTVRILSLTSRFGDAATTATFFSLENLMVIDRDYKMNCSTDAIQTIGTDSSVVASTGELLVSWGTNRASEEYDLEWTFIDSSALGSGRYHVSGVLNPDLIFRFNSSRVTVTGNQYRIPLLYDGSGWLFYRVRGAQNLANGVRNATTWSSSFMSSGGLGQYRFRGHERMLNWQASTAFAEEGKRKSVVQYFDGSLKSRQTVTKDNTSQMTVIAETMYDKQGRPQIQVMPAPTLSSLIAFTPQFNKNINGAEYDKGVYDTLNGPGSYCSDTSYRMDTMTTGASHYYSGMNEQKAIGAMGFIPNAYGYAFTESKYTQDNSGRVAVQGGVGYQLRFGLSNNTKYYYGSAEQEDLDALFGTEAGDASHYQKNLVQDPNGQLSVSYVDMHGRTVATALAGDTLQSLQDRTPEFAMSTETNQLITPTTNLIKGNSIELVKTLLVTKPGLHNFNYSLTPQSLLLNDCKNIQVCYDCLYDLVITITDDCNNQHLPGGQPVVYTQRNFSFGAIDTTCATSAQSLTYNLLNISLQTGSYTITKKLTVNEEAMQYYRDSMFLKHNTCVTYEDFIARQRLLIAAQLGNCVPDSIAATDFDQVKNQMLEDMMPLSGQYGVLEPPVGASVLGFNIFSAVNGVAVYRSVIYTKEDGTPDSVDLYRDGVLKRLPPSQLTQEEFIYYFKRYWAVNLVVKHPEYPLYVTYSKLSSSYLWDQKYEATETYSLARGYGFLNPTGSALAPASQFPISDSDPLFAAMTANFNSTLSNAAKQSINDSLFTFRVTPARTYTMWGFSTVLAKCTDPLLDACGATYNTNANVFGSALCTGELDMAWKEFRGLYLRAKQAYVDKFIRAQNPGVAYPPTGYISIFPILETSLGENGYTNIFETDANVLSGVANTRFAAQADQTCRQYAVHWLAQLGTCPYSETELNNVIIPRLVQVCKEGSDYQHPFGASSVVPTSTYQYRSFEDVINDYNSSHGITTNAGCNAYLIDEPKPYEQPSLIVDMPVVSKPDSCTCQRLSDLQAQFIASPNGAANFSQWLAINYQASISQGSIDSLLGLCNGSITCKFISNTILIPPVLQCGFTSPCIDCGKFKLAYTAYLQSFPDAIPSMDETDSAQIQKNLLFQNFMNTRFGFGKLAVDYLRFKDTCDGTGGTGQGCDSLKQIVEDFKKLRNEVKNGKAAFGWRVTPLLDEIKEGMNGLLEWKRRNQTGWYLSPRYSVQPVNFSLVNNFYAISYNPYSGSDSIFNMVLPLNIKYLYNGSGYYTKLKNTESVVGADFSGQYSSSDLSKRYYGTSLMEEWGRWRFMWAGAKTWGGLDPGCSSFSLAGYYGLSGPKSKFLNDSVCGEMNNGYVEAAFFPLPASVSTLTQYNNWQDTIAKSINKLPGTSLYEDDRLPLYGLLDTLKTSKKLFQNSDIRRIVDFRLDTVFLKLQKQSGIVFDHSRRGHYMRVELEMMDGSTKFASFCTTEDYNIYKEPIDTNITGYDCQKAFAAYYNSRRGTNLTYAQIATRYADSCGITLDVCDTAMTCGKLTDLVKNYQAIYINPSSGYVDLPMRTFAGNITPAEGQKGIFNVNGQLIGKTSGVTVMDIGQSFAKIWSSDAANKLVGSLTYMPSGLFRLSMKPGKQAPCQGIIGQRFYQFDVNVWDSLNAPFGVGEGSFVDFGDTTSLFTKGYNENGSASNFVIPSGARDVVTFKNVGIKNRENTNYLSGSYHTPKAFYIQHKFNKSPGLWKTYTVTVYHDDKEGQVSLNSYRETHAGVDKPMMNNVRGIWPQELIELNLYNATDSTAARTSAIQNFKQITSLQTFEISVRSPGVVDYDLNLESFENNHKLQFLWFDVSGKDPNTPVRPGKTVAEIMGSPFHKSFPNLLKNFPNLRVLVMQGWRGMEYMLDSSKYDLPSLTSLGWAFKDTLRSKQVDSLYNQLTRNNNTSQVWVDNSSAVTSLGAYTAASLTARNKMNTLLWAVPTVNSNPAKDPAYSQAYGYQNNDSLIMTNQFTEYVNMIQGTRYTYPQLQQLYKTKCGAPLNLCTLLPPVYNSLTGPKLCGQVSPPLVVGPVQPNPCDDSLFLITMTATEMYRAYRDSLKDAFNKAYMEKCLGAANLESFTMTRPLSEYHFTLYYYDQAGNLIKTISPNGVHPDHTPTYLAQIATKRAAKQFQDPAHTMPVLYRYNSLNQVVVQNTPDGGVSHFWYDRLGRLAVSQDARQATSTTNPKYSYTQYDFLGRITWVAEKIQPLAISNALVRNPTALLKWIEFRNDISLYQPQDMIQTVYDGVSNLQGVYASVTPFKQKSWTMRNRVSYQRYYEILPSSMSVNGTDTSYIPNTAYYTGGVDYSYDIHGNVDSLLNIYNRNLAMNYHGANNKYKLIAYNYDLISGKVNTVHYNPDNVDEFYHRYSYDAENRLTDVYTTDTRMFQGQESLEEHDAHYEYYRHGPMSRQVLGQQQVQGLDYTYTLQGWIKGVNTTTLDRFSDIGKDGQYTARDAFSYNLNYFSGDYQPINKAKPYADHETAVGTSYRPMYNGNINSMAVNIRQFDQPQLYAYKYDQLNRIKAMDVYRHTQATMAGNSWTGSTFTQEYRERVTYDPNGNILSYFRNGSGSNPSMDNLNYSYYPNTNQLSQITDGVADAAYANDLDNQAAKNYRYDNSGNLDTAIKERIDNVTWNVYGKIKKLSKTYPPSPTGSPRYVDYVYDVFGNRISKWVYTASPDPSGTFYVRDAQGNIMAEYEKATSANSTSAPMVLKRHYIYGSSRLGQIDRNQDIEQPKLTVVNENLIGPSIASAFSRGKKYYELSNHLSNVLVTISDRKFGPQDLAGHQVPAAVEYADPEVVTANDYYPFGMLMNGRNYNKTGLGDYKFGFNGKENDNDVLGEGNQQDYGMRIYDPRVGRFLSVDPLTKTYPWLSPYQFAGNDVMRNIDLDGAETYLQNVANFQKKQALLTFSAAQQKRLYPYGFIAAHKAGFGERVANFFNDPYNQTQFNTNPFGAGAKMLFSLSDDIKVTATSFMSNGRDATHIGGRPANFNDRMGSFVNLSMTAMTIGELRSPINESSMARRGEMAEDFFNKSEASNELAGAPDFKTFDKFDGTTATSIKSYDLSAPGYTSNPKSLTNSLNGYVRKTLNFESGTLQGISLESSQIKNIEISVALFGEAAPGQMSALQKSVQFGAENGVKVTFGIPRIPLSGSRFLGPAVLFRGASVIKNQIPEK